MSALSDKIYAWEGWIFNLICAFYFAFLSPLIVEYTVINVREEHSFFPWLGIALLSISFLELYAFPKKMKYVQKAILDHNNKEGNGIILWLCHMVLSIMIGFSAIEAFGLDIPKSEEENNTPWWFIALVITIVIKELYFLFIIMDTGEDKTKLDAYQRPNNKEWIVDLILLSYICLAYTATWQTMSYGMDMEKGNLPMYLVNIFASSILFLIFYMPLRIPYYLEEMAQMQTSKDRFKFIFSILVVLIATISSL